MSGNITGKSLQSNHLQNFVEDLQGYEPGGFCPLDLGDRLDDRFEIVHKLGYGGIATVWLCWEFKSQRWRAVKVNAASHSSPDCSDLKVLELMKDYSFSGGDDRNNDARVILALETFFINSLNGRHLCTVLPLLGPSLADWRVSIGDDSTRNRKICLQIVEGLHSLHLKGICHGDLRPQNVLMKLKSGILDGVGYDQFRGALGIPKTAPVLDVDGNRCPNAPKDCVVPMSWKGFPEIVSNDIAIVDLGEAHHISDPPAKLGIPWSYAAPEVIFGGRPGIGSDIWSLACTLLDFRAKKTCNTDVWSISRRMERFIGPLHQPYRSACYEMLCKTQMDEWEHEVELDGEEEAGPRPEPPEYSEDGPITGPLDEFLEESEEDEAQESDYDHSLLMKLGSEIAAIDSSQPSGVRYYHLPHREVLDLGDLLSQMFRYDQDERIGTLAIMGHAWFNDLPKSKFL